MPPRRALSTDHQDDIPGGGRGPPPPLPSPGDTATRVLEGIARLIEQDQQAPRPQADIYEQFRRLNPKEFGGTTDPFLAEGWVRSLELHIDYLQMRDGDRVRFAIYILRDDASRWWERAAHAVELNTLTWDMFKEMFYGKFFSANVRGRLTREFMSLRSGTRLRHNSSGNLIGAAILRPFHGCRPEAETAGYDEATACIFQTEQALWHIDSAEATSGPDQFSAKEESVYGATETAGQQKPQGQYRGPGQQWQPQAPGAPRPEGGLPCKHCNKYHYGKCMRSTFRCFVCKQEGHKAADCPQNKGPTTSRAYVMHSEEAEVELDSTLITDNLYT
ncbi:uncharacterized protein LOC142532259 [Primulina tabacum]|uniref:uncharacterized protein LOC142532259 n=1 Tax=Primulina tabacum TaxID=48773 RepID=UPI003F5A0F72